MKRLFIAVMIVAAAGFLASCEDWERVTEDTDYWSDSYTWINFAGVYRDDAGQFLIREHGVAAAVNASDTLGVGDTNFSIAFSGTLRHTPIVKGSVTITDGVETFTDASGSGVLVGDGGGSGSMNYQTGASSVDFAIFVQAGTSVRATYQYWGSGTSANPLPGTTGTQIFTMTVQQQGQILLLIDSDGMSYTGRISTASSSTGQDGQAPTGIVIANFTAYGTSSAGASVTIVGTLHAQFVRQQERATGGGGGTIYRYYLSDRTVSGTWLEAGGMTGDINGVTTEVEVTNTR